VSARRGLAALLLAGLTAAVSPSAATATDRFSLDDAYREEQSPQRSRISLNGLWRFQGARDVSGAPPAQGWYSLRVPGRWDKFDVAYGGFLVRGDGGRVFGDWFGIPWRDINQAWYQRDLLLPAECIERRVTLRFEHIGSGIDERMGEYEQAPAYDEGLRKNARVWVNGRRAEIADDWRVDITSLLRPEATNTISVGITSGGRMTRWGKGLTGDVWLECEPFIRIADVGWSTNFADRSLGLEVVVRNRMETSQSVRLRAVLGNTAVGETAVATLGGNAEARFALHAAVPTLPEWSEFAPNLTPLRLELLAGATLIDSVTEPIAMRDWRISGDRIVLNGRNIGLRTESGPTLGYGMEMFDRDFMRNYLAAYRAANYNGIRTGWGLAPDYVYDLTDELGLMVQCLLPSPAMFRARSGIRDDARFWPAYESALAGMISRTRRHVSVVAYVLWAHEAVDPLQTQPEHIDGSWHPLPIKNAERAALLKAADILRRLDPSREVLFDDAGNLGKALDVHAYFDFSVPLQEWEDWPERRAGKASKPLIVSEFGIPYIGSWGEWDPATLDFQGGANFVIENAARYLGDAAYLRSHSAMLPGDWRARGLGFTADSAVDPALSVTAEAVTRYSPNEAAEEVSAHIAARLYRAWRAAGVHLGPFGHDTMTGAAMMFRPREAARTPVYPSLKTPGPKPDVVVRNARSYVDTATPVGTTALLGDGEPVVDTTKVFAATRAAFCPLLVFLGGGTGEGLTGKDHAFSSGEAVEKSVVVVNDGPENTDLTIDWRLERVDGSVVLDRGTVSVDAEQGKTTVVPLRFLAPAVSERTDFRLVIEPRGRQAAQDEFALQVFPANPVPPTLPARWSIAVYDKNGMTTRVLDRMGVSSRRLEALGGAEDVDLLVIGAFSLDASAQALLPRIREGMSVLVFEQRVGAVGDRASFVGADLDTTHMAAAAARRVFPSDARHPLLAGLQPEDLANWRGASGLLPASAPASESNYLFLPGGVARVKVSNRGIVSSWVVPKPQRGNFRVIASTGFDLRQASAVEYFIGRGHVLLVQLDVTERYGLDPVATRLLHNALSYMSTKASPFGVAAYLGGARGERLLADLGVRYEELRDATPLALQSRAALLVGAGGEGTLAARRREILDWVKGGGRLLLCDDVVASLGAAWFPGRAAPVPTTLFKGRLATDEPLLRGLNQSDAYFREGLAFTRLAAGDNEDPSPVSIVHLGAGAIIALPALSTTTLATPARPATDKLLRLLSSVLTNAGVALDAPFRLYPEILDLTGDWRFKTDPEDHGLAAGWHRPDFDDTVWRTIRVPGLWAFQGVTEKPSTGFGYEGVAWYRRKLVVPPDWKGGNGKLVLVIGGVADTGDVYWDGTLIAHGADRSYAKDVVAIPVDDKLPRYGGSVTVAIKVVDKGPAGGIIGPIRIAKDQSWLMPQQRVRYGERYPDFEPDAFRSW